MRPSSQLKTLSEIRKGGLGNADGKRSDFYGYYRAAVSDEPSFSNHWLVGFGIPVNRRSRNLLQLSKREDQGFSQRAAASAVSSGRVLNAIEAPGSNLWTVLTISSNRSKFLGGIRMPPPITTQSYLTRESCRSIAEAAVPSGRTRQRSGCQPRSDICRIPTSMPAWIFFASKPGGSAGSEKSTVSGS